jgi:hypothetical protein
MRGDLEGSKARKGGIYISADGSKVSAKTRLWPFWQMLSFLKENSALQQKLSFRSSLLPA